LKNQVLFLEFFFLLFLNYLFNIYVGFAIIFPFIFFFFIHFTSFIEVGA
jgi:hypothetical protein